MSLRVTFDLTDADLKHFQLIMREARSAAQSLGPERIVASARGLLQQVRDVNVPQFIQERLSKLDTMIGMVEDSEWNLPPDEITRVLNALAYFAEPEDLIPDHIPGLGFLDDAIMVELVVRELRHEIEAYQDFCTYRAQEEKRLRRLGKDDFVSRANWLSTRRKELHERMRRRRRADRGRRRGGRSPMSLL